MKIQKIKITVKALRELNCPAFPEYAEDGEFSGSADDNVIEISFKNGIVEEFEEYTAQGVYLCNSYYRFELKDRGMFRLEDYEKAGMKVEA